MEEPETIGFISKIRAKPGFRDTLMQRLHECWKPIPGCVIYIVGADLTDTDLLWVTEFWEGRPVFEEVAKDATLNDQLAAARAITVATELRIEVRPIFAPVTV